MSFMKPFWHWATGYPPCRPTLQWLSELKVKYGDQTGGCCVGVALPSKGGLSMLPPRRRSATLRRSQPCSCSTSRERKTAKVVFGAPPDLHEQIGKMLSGLM